MNRLITLALVFVSAMPAASQAQMTLEEMAKIHSSATGKSDASTYDLLTNWLGYNRAGWRAIGKGYFDTAEHEFVSAIGVAKKLDAGGTDYRLLARSYADYAYAIQKQGRHTEAEPLVKWVLTVREAQLETDSPAIPQTMNQLAGLYYEVGRLAEAEPLLKRAIESQGNVSKPNPAEHARSHTLLGVLLVTQRRYAESETPFRRAMEIREMSRGSNDPETGDSLSNLAWAYHQQGKNDLARPLFDRALKIFEHSRGTLDPSVAHTLHGLAKIQSNETEPLEAELKFLKAISIWDHQLVLDPAALVEVLKDYADFLEKLGRAEDLVKIKARLSPLRAKVSQNEAKAGAWYRVPDSTPGNDVGVRRVRS